LTKGRQIRVEAGERLRTCPFVLHDAQEVDHLVAQRGKMSRRGGGDLARNAAQALPDELFQAPARAVARQHGQVVDVDVAALVRIGDLFVIDLAESQ
jgi:hypothetical protein